MLRFYGTGRGGAPDKIALLRGAGVRIVNDPSAVGEAMRRALSGED